MGGAGSKRIGDIRRCNFETVNMARHDGVIISAGPLVSYIEGTVDGDKANQVLDKCLREDPSKLVVFYGLNSTDSAPLHRWNNATQLGLENAHVYCGGMFEWLILGELYGNDMFPVTSIQDDLLKFK